MNGIFWFIIVGFVIAIPCTVFIAAVILIISNHEKISGDVVNYDAFMRNFVYQVNLSKDEILKSLRLPNIYDGLSYDFDEEQMEITFKCYEEKIKYKILITQCRGGFCILRLGWREGVSKFRRSQYHVEYQLNSFLKSKLNAVELPWSKYGVKI